MHQLTSVIRSVVLYAAPLCIGLQFYCAEARADVKGGHTVVVDGAPGCDCTNAPGKCGCVV